VDKPHVGYEYPHINTAPPVPVRNHTPIPEAMLPVASNAQTIARGIRYGATGVAVVADGVQLYQALEKDGFKAGPTTGAAATEIAGSWAGAWAGAKAGSLALGSVGTMIAPGPGTAVGGLIGGLAGGVAGAFGGRWAGRELGQELLK